MSATRKLRKLDYTIGVLRWRERDRRLVVGRTAANVQDKPAIGDLKEGRLAAAEYGPTQDAFIEVSRAPHIGYGQEVGDDKTFLRRKLKAL